MSIWEIPIRYANTVHHGAWIALSTGAVLTRREDGAASLSLEQARFLSLGSGRSQVSVSG